MDWLDKAQDNEEQLRCAFLQARAGDGPCYERLLRALSVQLRAYFRRRLSGSPNEVEDLVQETLLAIHSHRHTYQPDRPLTAWVHTIARYKLIDRLRARSRHDAIEVPLEDESLLAHTDAEAWQARRDLHLLLEALPENDRRVLVMVKLEGLTLRDVASALGISVSAARSALGRSFKSLSWRLRRHT